MNKNVLIAMSGGVDSSVAAYLLKLQGFDCTGAMMKLYANEGPETGHSKGCCSLEDARDARAVSFRMDIPFYVFNFTECFTEQVMGRFINAYSKGVTPNPCIDCNRYVKFVRFMKRAHEIGIDHIATGHYARTQYDAGGGRLIRRIILPVALPVAMPNILNICFTIFKERTIKFLERYKQNFIFNI